MSKIWIIPVIMLVLGAGVGGFLFVNFEKPDFGVEDIADVKSVDNDTTNITSKIWVNNNAGYPFPTGLVDASYDVEIQGIEMVRGKLDPPTLSRGNNTVQINSTVENKQIPDVWEAYIKNNETAEIKIGLSLDGVGPVKSKGLFSTSFSRTFGENGNPVESTLSQSLSGIEGNYTRNISVGNELFGTSVATETVGYQVKDAEIEIDRVENNTTILHLVLQVRNPSETIAVPAEPETLGISTEANNVTILTARSNGSVLVNSDNFEQGDVIEGPVILPQQQKEVVYRLELQNENMDDWFVSHIKNKEYTYLETDFQFVFSYQGTEFRFPSNSPVEYNCDIQTNFFYENKNQSVDCVKNFDQGTSGSNGNTSDSSDGSTSDNNSVQSNTAPVADINANKTSGSAPLGVSLSGEDSFDSDGSIESYTWSVQGFDSTRTGVNQEVSIPFPGEYTVTLTVEDNDGATNTTSTVITVS